MENFANEYQTSLSGAISDSDTEITVASASGAPDAPFRLRIGDELVLVTEVDGADFTIERAQEGTSAEAHADGSSVTQIVTVQGLKNVTQSMIIHCESNNPDPAPNGISGYVDMDTFYNWYTYDEISSDRLSELGLSYAGGEFTFERAGVLLLRWGFSIEENPGHLSSVYISQNSWGYWVSFTFQPTGNKVPPYNWDYFGTTAVMGEESDTFGLKQIGYTGEAPILAYAAFDIIRISYGIGGVY